MSLNIFEIGDDLFESEVLKENGPVVVDFWAPWCGPCKAIGPVLDELARDFGNKVKFVKCNVDENPVTPGKYGVKAIPTLIFFKNGKIMEKVTGMVGKSKLEEVIERVVS